MLIGYFSKPVSHDNTILSIAPLYRQNAWCGQLRITVSQESMNAKSEFVLPEIIDSKTNFVCDRYPIIDRFAAVVGTQLVR